MSFDPENPTTEQMKAWLAKSCDLSTKVNGIPEPQSVVLEDDGTLEEHLPPGRSPDVTIAMRTVVCGPPLVMSQDPARYDLDEAIRDALRKRAKIQRHIENLERRATQLLVKAQAVEGLRGSARAWSEYFTCLKALKDLLDRDSQQVQAVMAYRRSKGDDIGEMETPEEAVEKARATPGTASAEVTDGPSAPPPAPMSRREFPLPKALSGGVAWKRDSTPSVAVGEDDDES